jgi:hypothetical protein
MKMAGCLLGCCGKLLPVYTALQPRRQPPSVGENIKPNVRRKNTKGNPDVFPEREERCWMSEEEVERKRCEVGQAGGVGHRRKRRMLVSFFRLCSECENS